MLLMQAQNTAYGSFNFSGWFVHIGVFSLWMLTPCALQAAEDSAIQRAVVKVLSKNRPINLSAPWRRSTPNAVSGSGVIIAPGRVLTNAHVVVNSAELNLQPFESSDEIPAKVVSLGAGIDLAILEFDQSSALGTVKPLSFVDAMPEIRSTVRVYG